jgi:hypothetical protein
MGLIFIRHVRPDADVWPGRRLLAVLDAVAWPALWIYAIWNLPFHTGIAGELAIAIATFVALPRMLKAWTRNERYSFSTWRWGRVVVALILVGVALKIALVMQVL